MKSLLYRIPLAASTISICVVISACTQWGTSIFRPVDIWWACPDRNSPCSPENATLTLIQADNMLAGAKKDLHRAMSNPNAETARLELAISLAELARVHVSSGTWDSYLADYVQAALDAEREAAKFWPKRTSLVPQQ